MKMYDWGVFWEDGNRANLPVPFGPVSPDNLLTLESEWVDKLEVYYPKFRQTVGQRPFECIVVNPPREAAPEEEHHWNMKGYK